MSSSLPGALALVIAALVLVVTPSCDATLNLEGPLDTLDTASGLDLATEDGLVDDTAGADPAEAELGAPLDAGVDESRDETSAGDEVVADVAETLSDALAETLSDAPAEISEAEVAEIPCETSDPCRVAKRRPDGSCEILPLSCASPNACQLAHCDAGIGHCVLDPVDCDDHDPHTQDWCSPDAGCVHLGGSCGDDVCTPGEHESCPGDCKPGGPECGDGLCEGMEPGHCPVDCKELPPECGDGQCAMPELWMCPADCPAFICNDGECWPGEAFFCSEDCEATSACDDDDRCTVDWHDGDDVCHHDPISCDDGSDCTLDACLPSAGCIYTDACADDDPCTEGICWFGHCAVTTLPWCE